MKAYITLIGFSLMAFTAPAFAGDPRSGGSHNEFEGPVGLQLYSFREYFENDVEGTLDMVQDLGFKEVELAGTYGMTPEAFRRALVSRGLEPVSAHYGYDQWRDDPEAVVREAKILGLKYAGCAWIPDHDPFTEERCREVAAVFNKAGAVAAREGIQFFYHNHGYEFRPYGDGTLFDLLMELTDPELVALEMDLLWTVFPGQDPVALLEKYGSRWQLLHLKDLRKGVEGNLSGGTDTRNDVALGTGQVDFPAVLATARKIGVKHYFIEDESPTVREQIPHSLKYLARVSW